jgi:hypothetical protein
MLVDRPGGFHSRQSSQLLKDPIEKFGATLPGKIFYCVATHYMYSEKPIGVKSRI